MAKSKSQSKSKKSASKNGRSSKARGASKRSSSAKRSASRKPSGEALARQRSAPAGSSQKMYREIASWWPLLSAPEEYEEEAKFYLATLLRGCERKPRTLLELGSGGGNNAWYMKRSFDRVVLADLSPDMLAVSAKLNPDCEHVEGDMRTVRLGRTFDCVFVHDAVMYMTSERDLRQAMETAFLHCNPGGAALFCPDYVRETFKAENDCGGHDSRTSLRAMRYLDWVWDPDPTDTTYTVDYAYLLRDEDGSVRVEHDRHLEGIFGREDWMRWLDQAGFRSERVTFDHSELEPGRYEIFLARKLG